MYYSYSGNKDWFPAREPLQTKQFWHGFAQADLFRML